MAVSTTTVWRGEWQGQEGWAPSVPLLTGPWHLGILPVECPSLRLKVNLNSWEIYGGDLGWCVWAWELLTGPSYSHTAPL